MKFTLGLRLCILLAGCWSCAGLEQERNLAPLYAHYSTGGGGVETEALGGAVLVERPSSFSSISRWYLKPLLSWRRAPTGEELTWYIPPLGSYRRTTKSNIWQFLPLLRYAVETRPDGRKSWTWISLPGIYWTKTIDGRVVRAWFPFLGRVEHFLSFDRAEFFLFPLYSRVKRHGQATWHVLWPFFSWGEGRGGNSWRIWPLLGHRRWKGRYDRWFFLWPIFQYQRNDLAAAPERQGRSWTVFPLYQESRQGSLVSRAVLWPFFGYASDKKSGFWAWDGPWPLVRWMEPGDSQSPTRHRVWPLYSFYKGDGLTSRYYLWPFINFRHEQYRTSSRSSAYVLPFWQAIDRLDLEQGASSYRKLWPLFRRETQGEQSFLAFPALNPLWRTPVLDEHWAWIWELYTRTEQGPILRQRSWLGLWRHERDADEDRQALSGLWARRRYSLAGEAVHETSWLFGLLRYRTSPSRGLEWLAPALPGPGWPITRVPNSILPPRDFESDAAGSLHEEKD